MHNTMNNSYLLVDINRLRGNIESIIASLPEGSVLLPMLKCNAYGIGIEAAVRLVSEFEEIPGIAAAQVIEALEIRSFGYKKDILVVGAAFSAEQRRAALENDITLTAYSLPFISSLYEEASSLNIPAKIHIKINTGLNRLGFVPGDELDSAIALLKKYSKQLQVTGTFSHFSDMEAPDGKEAEAQYSAFCSALRQLENAGIKPGMRHICASAGLEFHPEWALDAVRIGRRLYYDNPVRPDGHISEALSWRAFITDIHFRSKGEKTGYGSGYILPEDTRIAVLGIGYGDGMLRELSSVHAPVLINGRKAPLLCCTMDQCFIDISDIDCNIGDEAVIIGYDSIGNLLPGQQSAALFNDEACSVTAALGKRVKRIYIG